MKKPPPPPAMDADTKERIQHAAVARVQAACAAAGLEFHWPTAMIDAEADRIDVFPRISMRFSDVVREVGAC
jgi:hypothetical protein